jgi:DNA-binding IclR family transcriptional regulator
MPQTIGSLGKALDLIDMLAEHGPELGISDLARRLDLSKNQVFRILKTLEQHGYVHQAENRAYQLGFRFFSVGQRVVEHADVVQIALPLMDQLRDATGESVHLLVLDGYGAVCTARRESPAFIRMSADVGRRFLLHAGACPKAILAFQTSAFIESAIERRGLPRYTEHTITDPAELQQHLGAIRAHGYSVSDEDIDVHAFAVAVPIYDRHGSVSAAMSIAGPATRFARGKRARALGLLVEACDSVSVALGALRLPSAGIAPAAFDPDASASEQEGPLTRAG